MILLAVIVALLAPTPAFPAIATAQRERMESASESRDTLDAILAAVRAVETGSEPDGGRSALGDGGRALGPYQIHRAYYVDSGVAGTYEDCAEAEFSRRVVLAYWKRWCPDALARRDASILSRVHNGGPRGARKSATLAYWHRVESLLVGTRLERATPRP